MRCTSAYSTGPCDPCRSKGLACINGSGITSFKRSDETSPVSTPSDVSSKLPEGPELRRLLEAYFDGPHYFCFYTFIHQPTMMQMFDNGQVPECLILIIIATSLHFLEPSDPRPGLWADECRRLVIPDIFPPPSTTTLQALLLLQRYEWHRASHISAWFIAGLAIRLAHGLQLNIEVPDQVRVPATVKETRRRLMWSCLVMESMIDAGRKPLSGLNVSSIEVKVPCNERSFQLSLETNMPDSDHILGHASASETSRPGISAFLVKLAILRRDILDYTLPYHPRNCGHIPSTSPWAPDAPFSDHEHKLEQWRSCLPDDLKFTAQVMYRRRSQLATLVTLHCLFHGCYCDLYRVGSYLTARRRSSFDESIPAAVPSSFLTACRRGRLQHAFKICEIISDSMEHKVIGHDPVVGISAALAIRVLVVERQPDDSVTLGVSDEMLYPYLDAAVECAKGIAVRSMPIRELVRASFCLRRRRMSTLID